MKQKGLSRKLLQQQARKEKIKLIGKLDKIYISVGKVRLREQTSEFNGLLRQNIVTLKQNTVRLLTLYVRKSFVQSFYFVFPS